MEPAANLSALDVGVVVVYLLAILPVGLFLGGRAKTESDFAIAGRRLSARSVGLSAFISWVGLAGLFGTVENVYKFGLSGIWWFQAWLPGVLLMAYLLATRLRGRLHVTVPEIISAHSGPRARVVASLVTSWNYLAWVAVQVFALGTIFRMCTPVGPTTGTIIAFLIVVAYTLSGGLSAVVVTDIFQATIVIGVILIAAPLAALVRGGGLSEVVAQTREIPDFYTLFKGAGGRTLTVWFISLLPAAFIDPGGLQKAFAASDPATARRGLLLSAALYFLLGLSVTFLGVVARAALPAVDPQQAMPAVLLHVLPSGFAGLAIVAFLGAAMSTADTALVVVATTLQRDVYAPLRPDASGKERLLVTRALVLLFGLTALLIALTAEGVVAILLMGFALYVPGLFLPMLAASFGWRLPRRAMLLTILAGAGSAALWTILKEPKVPAIVIGLAVSLVPFSVGLLLDRDRRDRR
ncbi:MAG: sodium:solute symporter family protein [Lentisphaerae bacterium]|jgi:solute:Na+ symporter, SSS family|nr:sodium:solute symporter family protein [Lentisphaerota bacterium]MBT4816342.1 sodium:solute symporter family protein [Lentisphaerota bacterium]MBT5608853.1 sodium:solute symporter family protein [Lentisphaerota bacterium]MBT7058733.1 sodium:solute symporter family protein [Lentisphaerota bacterium]MBT7845060.1 sodium:solute symporter family protein [Lentisphaerota bacterium]